MMSTRGIPSQYDVASRLSNGRTYAHRPSPSKRRPSQCDGASPALARAAAIAARRASAGDDDVVSDTWKLALTVSFWKAAAGQRPITSVDTPLAAAAHASASIAAPGR